MLDLGTCSNGPRTPLFLWESQCVRDGLREHRRPAITSGCVLPGDDNLYFDFGFGSARQEEPNVRLSAPTDRPVFPSSFSTGDRYLTTSLHLVEVGISDLPFPCVLISGGGVLTYNYI